MCSSLSPSKKPQIFLRSAQWTGRLKRARRVLNDGKRSEVCSAEHP